MLQCVLRVFSLDSLLLLCSVCHALHGFWYRAFLMQLADVLDLKLRAQDKALASLQKMCKVVSGSVAYSAGTVSLAYFYEAVREKKPASFRLAFLSSSDLLPN